MFASYSGQSPMSFGNAANPPAKTGFLGTCPRCGDISLTLKFNTDSPMVENTKKAFRNLESF